VIKGKLKYMAPEQASGNAIDHRADLFAVGVMLWEAMTGDRRFPNDFNDVAAYSRVQSGAMPETPDATRLGYPAELNDILKRALAPDPAERYQTAHEFHEDLEEALRTMPPCSLKELGADAAVAFTRERLEIGAVVEKCLRGFAPERTSAKGSDDSPTSSDEVPTVRPPRGTGSNIDRPEKALPALAPLPRDLMEAGAASGLAQNGSTQHSLVARSLAHLKPAPSANARVAAVVALGLGLAFVAAWRGPGPAGRAVGASGEVAPSAPRAEARVQSGPASPSSEPESAVPAIEPRGAPVEASAPVAMGDTPMPPAPSQSVRAPAAPARATQTRSRSAAPVTDAAASPASPATAAPAAPTPSGERPVGPRSSPKVQLERDNPWKD
jgi:serine/threonine-protein kinase